MYTADVFFHRLRVTVAGSDLRRGQQLTVKQTRLSLLLTRPHVWYFQNGTMSKMTKFEIELPIVPKPAKLSLSERDIAMATM